MTRHLVVVLSILAASVNAYSCWDRWGEVNLARAGGNVVEYGTFAYLVGGTSTSVYNECRENYLIMAAEKGDNYAAEHYVCKVPDSTWVKIVEPVEMEMGYAEPVKSGGLSQGLHGRSFASRIGEYVYVCYGCRWSLDGVLSSTLKKFLVNDYGTAVTLEDAGEIDVRRKGASLAKFGNKLYVFGGLDYVRPPRAIEYVLQIDPATGQQAKLLDGPWAPKGMSGFCDCSTATTQTGIVLYNCLNCTSQAYIPNVFTFNIKEGGKWTTSPSILPKGVSPQIGASNAVSMGRFIVSVWPNGPAGGGQSWSPGTQMYDPELGVPFQYPVEQASPVNHPQLLSLGTFVYMFGGSTISTLPGIGTAPPNVSNATMVPINTASPAGGEQAIYDIRRVRLVSNTEVYKSTSPIASPNSTLRLRNTAECQSKTEKLALSLDPNCDRLLSYTDLVKCASGKDLFFNVDNLPPNTKHLWMCRTEGICDATTSCHATIAVNQSNAQSDCRWEGCCFTAAGACVGTKEVATETDAKSAYWVLTTVTPIEVETLIPSPGPTPFVQSKWFKLIMGLTGALILYLIILCCWRSRSVRRGSGVGSSTLDSLFSNDTSFGVFGKKYQVIKRIGQGGFGTVFHAIRRSDKTDVAIKYIPCDQPKARDAALSEFDLSQKVRHPNKVDCLDLVVHWGEEGATDMESRRESKKKSSAEKKVTIRTPSALKDEDGSDRKSNSTDPLLKSVNKFVCLVMPMYPLGDLSRFTIRYMEENSGNTLPPLIVLSICRQLADVTNYLHSIEPPVIHRDLKPENILVADENCDRVVVTDFGMAHYQPQTYMTTRAGTLHYAAPETWKKQYTAAVDVWSLGCIFYAVATGNVTSETTRVMFNDVEEEGFAESITSDLVKCGFSSSFPKLILEMLNTDPKARISTRKMYASIKQLHTQLVQRAAEAKDCIN